MSYLWQVTGIAGTPDKCNLVKRLGADECVNYRSESFKEDLIRATDGYVDAYFGIPPTRPVQLYSGVYTKLTKQTTWVAQSSTSCLLA